VAGHSGLVGDWVSKLQRQAGFTTMLAWLKYQRAKAGYLADQWRAERKFARQRKAAIAAKSDWDEEANLGDERLELRLKVITALTGIVGALIGLVAMLKK
jgi:hypothetical protein